MNDTGFKHSAPGIKTAYQARWKIFQNRRGAGRPEDTPFWELGGGHTARRGFKLRKETGFFSGLYGRIITCFVFKEVSAVNNNYQADYLNDAPR